MIAQTTNTLLESYNRKARHSEIPVPGFSIYLELFATVHFRSSTVGRKYHGSK